MAGCREELWKQSLEPSCPKNLQDGVPMFVAGIPPVPATQYFEIIHLLTKEVGFEYLIVTHQGAETSK